jgi:hypothetical protein
MATGLCISPGSESPLAVEAPDGSNVYFIAADVNLEAIPILAFFAPSWIYFAEVLAFVMQGRWAHYLPTISETGIEDFGNKVQSRAFASIGLVYFAGNILITLCRSGPELRSVIRQATVSFLTIGIAGMIGFGFADLQHHMIAHRVIGFFGLNSLNLFVSLSLKMMAGGMTRLQQVGRTLLSAAAWIGFFVAAYAELLFDPRICIDLSTWGEYVMIGAMQGYLASFYPEMRRCQLTIFFVEDQNENRHFDRRKQTF